MAGIPSAGGAGFAPWLTRVLLRIAMLVGLIVGGWLLGSATALAQDNSGNATPETIFADHSVESAPASVLGAVPVVGSAVQEALPPAVSATLSEVASLPPVSGQQPSLDTVLGPVLHPVTATVHPDATGSPAPAPVTAPERFAHTPAVEVPAGMRPHAPTAPPAPMLAPPPPGPSSSQHVVQAPLAHHVQTDIAGRPAAADHSTVPTPAQPPVPAEGTGLFCPAGSTGGGATTHGSQSVTLDDQRGGAEPALMQQRLRSCVADLSGWHTQRPSTSPD